MDWDWEPDDEDTYTAYHEAGHAIIGCALGARIESVSLSQQSGFDDEQPRRFGDCIVNWGRIDPDHLWQQQRELLTILAGPVAEWVYRGEDADEFDAASWQSDWQQAQRCVATMVSGTEKQHRLLGSVVARLRKMMSREPVWSAVAALADELTIGDPIEAERVAELVLFWWQE
ncbi:cell division protein FtsH [Allorhodopirellula heiligendammensis]|uniref:ATP-dependent zinc metalloprotease FtsH n=1 Tax=Allorhodopirellula heiligendammensis TaxID=2714739 RepID=A0A5C6C3S2_9BACT|nr:cell division protein FtsH [Allorhodopirellula heiligendammensis]TWU18677.1 hypothetical protein Poly21_08410 [Allorhodopirellula heiligendammensis]